LSFLIKKTSRILLCNPKHGDIFSYLTLGYSIEENKPIVKLLEKIKK